MILQAYHSSGRPLGSECNWNPLVDAERTADFHRAAGYTDGSGMPHLLQQALSGREFSDVIVFRSPPLLVQRALFGATDANRAPGRLRATYPLVVADGAGLCRSERYCCRRSVP